MITFGEMPDEIFIHILADLIYSRNFPSSLSTFFNVDRHAFLLSGDRGLWRRALRAYFPITEQHHDHFHQAPLQRFKSSYQRCLPFLQGEGLTFRDYVHFLYYPQFCTVSDNQKAVLVGLAMAAGHTPIADAETMAIAKNHALVFCSLLENKALFFDLINDRPRDVAFKRRSFIIAAELGFLPIVSYLIWHPDAAIDRSTMSEALIKAAANGHFHVVQLFLMAPQVQIVTFALPKALKLACMQGHAEIVKQLIKNAFLRTNFFALSDAIRMAVNNNHTEIVAMLLQAPTISSNTDLMLELFKASIQLRNSRMTETILTHAQLQCTLTAVLECIQKAMQNNDEATANVILSKKMAMITPYARRKLFFLAAEKGYTAMVSSLVAASPKVFTAEQMRQALRIARTHHHDNVVDYLMPLTPLPVVHSVIEDLDGLLHRFSALSISNPPPQQPDHVFLSQFGKVQKMVDDIENRAKEGNKLKCASRTPPRKDKQFHL